VVAKPRKRKHQLAISRRCSDWLPIHKWAFSLEFTFVAANLAPVSGLTE
jgi:hypothetical protein